MTLIIIYLLIVLGGWLRLRPGRCTKQNFYYQIWVNLFIEADRSIRDIFRGEERRETLSSWAARENRTWMIIFNCLMLDPNHCQKYAGT